MFENPEIAFGSNAELLSLIELIYSAVGQPELWQKVLERISDAVHGGATVLWAPFPTDNFIAVTRFAPGSWEQYAEYYSGVNVLMPRCDDRFPDGTVRYSHLVMEDAEFERTEFYADFFRPWDMHFSFGMKVPLGELPSAYISCQRSKTRGPFEEREGLVYQTLLPHMQRALRLHLDLSHMRAKTEGLETALNAFGHAVLGVNDEGRVILANREAQHLISDGGSLCLRNGLIRATLSGLDSQLQAMLRDAIGAGPIPSSFSEGALTISRWGAEGTSSGCDLSVLWPAPRQHLLDRSSDFRYRSWKCATLARVNPSALVRVDTHGIAHR